MMRRLDHDLARWEAEEITLEEVARRHPGASISAVTGLHARLTSLADAPSPDPSAAWTAVTKRLPTGPPTARSRRLRRPVIAALVASLLAIPTVSYAAAPDAVRSAVRRVADLFPGTDDARGGEGVDDDITPTTASEPSGGDPDPSSGPHPGTTADDDDGDSDAGDSDDDDDPAVGGSEGDTTPNEVDDDGTEDQPVEAEDHESSDSDDPDEIDDPTTRTIDSTSDTDPDDFRSPEVDD